MIPFGLWPRYAAFWVSGCPPRGYPYDADSIFGLAYGRNSILDDNLQRVGQEFLRCDCNDRTARTALLRTGFQAGQSNKDLAVEATEKSRQLGDIPLVLQWEIYVALNHAWLEEHPGMAFPIWPPAQYTKYWNSRDVAMAGLQIMQREGLHRPALLAHKEHSLRGYLLVRPVLGKDLIVLPQATESFDPFSIQKHTRSREEWLKREPFARVHHVVRGLV